MHKYVLCSLSFALLAGCSMVPGYEAPQVQIPSHWSQPQNTESAVIAKQWWENFASPELNTLMAQALAGNHDLRAGVQRVEQSRAALKIAGATLLPSASASAGAGRTKTNLAEDGRTLETELSAGAGISYELDIFGANRAEISGARAALASTQFGEDALALVVMGDVAQGYFNVLTARERLRIADSNLKNVREVMRIVQARVDIGTESALELAQQSGKVATNEASRAAVEKQMRVSENALAVLLGQAPQSLKIQAQSLDGMMLPVINVAQPSSLLTRRPDIRAAEADLIEANADIGAARAAMFPQVDLGLDWDVVTSGLSDPTTTALSLLSSLSAPIFQGGRLQGGVEQANARQKELVEMYHKTVLVAFQDVEDALAGVKASYMREQSFGRAREEAQKAYDLSKQRYDVGAIDFKTLLDTQDALLVAQDSYAQARLERLAAAVDLYKALGGGWSS